MALSPPKSPLQKHLFGYTVGQTNAPDIYLDNKKDKAPCIFFIAIK